MEITKFIKRQLAMAGAIWLIIGVLSLAACISISISNNEGNATSDVIDSEKDSELGTINKESEDAGETGQGQ